MYGTYVLVWTATVAAWAITSTSAFTSTTPSMRTTTFVSRSALHMSHATSHHDEWDLPEDGHGASSMSPPEMSETRRQRFEKEAILHSKYVTGDDLHVLRQEALSLRQELKEARKLSATRRVDELERAILKVQQVDAEFIYSVALERMQASEAAGHLEEADLYRKHAMEARSALPQFGLDGLWVGKYGDDCYEMINVTYVGDTLIAYKVTGHSAVPKGEISFMVDMNPLSITAEGMLDPIELGENASKQWGAKYLPRFAGDGQVASEGFANSQFVDGQLIIVNEYFSFAWVPLGLQVFFGRPTDDLTIKMLKDAEEPSSREEEMRSHIMRCMEETELLEDEMDETEGGRFSHKNDHYDSPGCFE